MRNSLKLGVAGLLLAAFCALSACHTVHGIGEDVASGGHHIEKAAS